MTMTAMIEGEGQVVALDWYCKSPRLLPRDFLLLRYAHHDREDREELRRRVKGRRRGRRVGSTRWLSKILRQK